MAYTVTWDETQPFGSANANTIHTIIQGVKRDVRERIDSIFGTSAATSFGQADPFAPRTISLNRADAVNDVSAAVATFAGGTDGTLGPLYVQFQVKPSATGTNRQVLLYVGDNAGNRGLTLSASLFTFTNAIQIQNVTAAAPVRITSASSSDVAGIVFTCPSIQSWSIGILPTGKFSISVGSNFAGAEFVSIAANGIDKLIFGASGDPGGSDPIRGIGDIQIRGTAVRQTVTSGSTGSPQVDTFLGFRLNNASGDALLTVSNSFATNSAWWPSIFARTPGNVLTKVAEFFAQGAWFYGLSRFVKASRLNSSVNVAGGFNSTIDAAYGLNLINITSNGNITVTGLTNVNGGDVITLHFQNGTGGNFTGVISIANFTSVVSDIDSSNVVVRSLPQSVSCATNVLASGSSIIFELAYSAAGVPMITAVRRQ